MSLQQHVFNVFEFAYVYIKMSHVLQYHMKQYVTISLYMQESQPLWGFFGAL